MNESSLQISCIKWFRLKYPQYSLNLFAVPNGGYRRKVTAVRMVKEGLLSGVSDLLFLLPTKDYHGLCIELKYNKNKMTSNQKRWANHISKYNYKHIVVYTLDDFISEINSYIYADAYPKTHN